MRQSQIRELLTQWIRTMDRRARRAFGSEVVQKDFSSVLVVLSAAGLAVRPRLEGGGSSIEILLDPDSAPFLEDIRRFVLETIKEKEDLAVKRELARGEFAGFAAELKRDLAEDAIVGDL